MDRFYFAEHFGMPWTIQDDLAAAHLALHPDHNTMDMRLDGGPLMCLKCEKLQFEEKYGKYND